MEVESVHARSYFWRSLGGLDPKRIAVCWSRVCMYDYWQGGGGMGCRRWLGCEGGIGGFGQCGSEGIVQVRRDHSARGRHGQYECRKPSYNYCGAGAEGLG